MQTQNEDKDDEFETVITSSDLYEERENSCKAVQSYRKDDDELFSSNNWSSIYTTVLEKRKSADNISKKSKKKKKKKKKYSGEWDYYEDYSTEVSPIVAQDSIPVDFEKSLTDNEREVRKGNSVPEWMRLDLFKDGGFHFGKKDFCDNFYVGKPQYKDGHILIVGGPGSHKTSGEIIPTFATWQGHIVVIDVKPTGDLLSQCKRMSQAMGKHTLVFNPYSEDACRIEPFDFLRTDGKENLAQNALELALSLISLMPEDKAPIWVKSAQRLLAGVIAFHFEAGETFSKAMETIQKYSVEELVQMIEGDRNKNTVSKMFVSKIKGLKPETLAGIGMDLIDLAILAADSHIQSALCPNEESWQIKWSYLNTAKDPFNIVLQLPEEHLDTWEPMTKLLINQLIRTMQRRPDKYSEEGKNLPPVLIILDEFASLGKISSIKSGMATLRSRGVTFALVIQSLSQLDEIYGSEARKVIFDLCSYKVILNVNDPESQRYFSDIIGTLIVPSRSVSIAHKLDTDEMNSYNLQINESREPIIFPHEFATLKDIVLMTPDGYCRIDKAPYYEQSTLVDSAGIIYIE